MKALTGRTAIIVARQPLWIDALGQLLGRIGITVHGHTTSPRDALALVQENESDLLIVELDASDSEMDGWQCLLQAREARPDVTVIAVADDVTERTVEAAFGYGAAAFCSKAADPEDFAAAIRQSFDHSIYLATSRGEAVVSAGHVVDQPVAPTPNHELTRRELEILQLVAEGHSNSQLGRMLWVTEQTIKFHLSNIYRKLGVANRTEASRWAQVNGLLPTARGTVSRSAA
jgi:DNA-binding NarL/FixJ family response regulator